MAPVNDFLVRGLFMKFTSIRPPVVALLSAVLLASTLSACGHRGGDRHEPSRGDEARMERHGAGRGEPPGFGPGRHERGHGEPMSADEAKRLRAEFTTRITSNLGLNKTQQALLEAWADALDRQRLARDTLRGTAKAPEASGPALWMRGAKFDRAAAQADLDARIAALKAGEPEVMNAGANFYDSLDAAQQEKARTLMAHRGGRDHHRPHAPR
jgi:periplasmic protein CpxP/Spy